MTPLQRILVVGGTGTLGQALIPKLVAKGKSVFLMTRNPDKMKHFNVHGVTVIKGDLTDKASLITACNGMDAVICAAHALIGKGRNASRHVDDVGQHALIEAAKNSGVKYFQFVSVIGATPDHECDFWRTKWKVENALKQSGLAYNIIRASAYMELHVHEFIGKSIMQKGKAIILGKGENRTNFVSVKDVAHLMVLCLDNPEKHERTIEIGGIDNFSRREIVDLYAAKMEKTIKTKHISRGALRILSAMIKPFHPGVSRVMTMSEIFDRTDQSFDANPVLKEFQIESMRLTDFVKADVPG